MTTSSSFDQLVRTAMGHDPYPWQRRVALAGLPELLDVETGAGKTAGVVLPWLFRRRFHDEPAVRSATPRWLVLCLPLRVLVEQVQGEVEGWLERLGLRDEVLMHTVMGGRERARDPWRLHPERDAVVIGTVDMLLSRALCRGYAAGRFSWPIDHGLFNNGTHWVFDEVQLLGPALATGRQLQGLRDRFGTAMPTSSTWMSATVEPSSLSTVDNPEVGSVVRLDDADRSDSALRRRLDAGKTVREVDAGPAKTRARTLARALVDAHRRGTLTVAVVNTVKAAQNLYVEVGKITGDVPVTLLHSRYRPPDRAARAAEALATVDAQGPGRIVVSTQVVEAGVDISATTLLTEAAPWPSIVQRAGRCNRDGASEDAQMLWVEAEGTGPYDADDVAAASAALREIERDVVTASSLRERDVPMASRTYAVLRRSDVLGLFDTAPDLSGNDVDVSAFIREGEELDLHVAWRELGGRRPAPDAPAPTAGELCPVPAGKEMRDLVVEHSFWRRDHLAVGDEAWVRVRREDVRPGAVVLADSTVGCYRPDVGWQAGLREAVLPMMGGQGAGLGGPGEGLGDDPVTFAPGRWVPLLDHLAATEAEARSMLDGLGVPGLEPRHREAAVVAAAWHDLGKAHPVFQRTMERSADEDDRAWVRQGAPWAKSGGSRRPRHDPPFFRHELAGALALLGDGSVVLQGHPDPDLAVYLVAAHHGRVRLGIRSVPEEERSGRVLGIAEGDVLPSVAVPGGHVPTSTLSLEVARLGRGPDGSPSWSERALGLLHREDLGPFRLSFLEAVVRLADWRASAEAEVAP